jgi:hypothetical protein
MPLSPPVKFQFDVLALKESECQTARWVIGLKTPGCQAILRKKMPFFGLDLPAAGKRTLRQTDAHEKPPPLSARQAKISAPGDYFAHYLFNGARCQRPARFLKKPDLISSRWAKA